LLLAYSAILESLLADAAGQLEVYNDLFDRRLAIGMRGLNAGLARGTLKTPENNGHSQEYDRSAIYLLPSTTEDLPPVAGIITAGKGNILSHVQLLARNLGIPNVAVDETLLDTIAARLGTRVVLAVSPRGVVQLVADGPRWDSVFAAETKVQDVSIRPDLTKLDLYDISFIPLRQMRATDSGRIAGPKAANLGELKHYFPDAVTNGLVIPFGHFRALLDRPMEAGGPSVFSWMLQQYQTIQSLKGQPREQEAHIRQFLEKMQDWISNAAPAEDFRRRLKEAMEENFGPDGTYGVFVRSDTNVEDLPGFTGAGLNLTVPNVVGFENVLKAISQVWASPFTERAYHWRQAYMPSPEHVYVSVLLLKSVPADKSGVMVTADVNTGRPGWLTIAVNEGVGGAVAGQTAEELRIRPADGRVQLLSPATEPYKRVLLKEGGIARIPVDNEEAVLRPAEIARLIEFAGTVPEQFPMLRNVQGQAVPADIEFGFCDGRLALFQIRPFLESARARQNILLNSLDQRLTEKQSMIVDLDRVPREASQ
jgi:phosphohistidine swiveling domain-containing protein